MDNSDNKTSIPLLPPSYDSIDAATNSKLSSSATQDPQATNVSIQMKPL